jgi:pimeloyl-ACP methyl ester carboxylesterase
MTPAQRIVTASDGRELMAYEAGDPAGPAILVHHGTPDHGVPFAPWADDAAARGIRLLGYDRPGYGASTPHPGRRVADAARDAEALADALGVGRFATWGISGGGPHALACAALLPDRVAAAAALGAIAPFDAENLNVFRGMGRDNWVELGAALQGRGPLEALLGPQAEAMVAVSPADLTSLMRTLVSDVDQVALDSGLARTGPPASRGASGRAPSAGSTTTWRSSSRGASTWRPSRSRCSSGTAAMTGSCRLPTASGSRAGSAGRRRASAGRTAT